MDRQSRADAQQTIVIPQTLPRRGAVPQEVLEVDHRLVVRVRPCPRPGDEVRKAAPALGSVEEVLLGLEAELPEVDPLGDLRQQQRHEIGREGDGEPLEELVVDATHGFSSAGCAGLRIPFEERRTYGSGRILRRISDFFRSTPTTCFFSAPCVSFTAPHPRLD